MEAAIDLSLVSRVPKVGLSLVQKREHLSSSSSSKDGLHKRCCAGRIMLARLQAGFRVAHVASSCNHNSSLSSRLTALPLLLKASNIKLLRTVPETTCNYVTTCSSQQADNRVLIGSVEHTPNKPKKPYSLSLSLFEATKTVDSKY